MNKYQSEFLDEICNKSTNIHNNIPLPLEIEISLVDKCNRKCIFCPRYDDKIAPNTDLIIPKKLYEKISRELKVLKFKGLIVLGGYGEPLLHKNILEISKLFSFANTIITTNGDFLTKELAKSLQNVGIKKILVSIYEKRVISRLLAIQEELKDFIVLRNRYSKNMSSLNFTNNRAGTLNKKHLNQKCYYPFYMIMIDSNGDVLTCCHDWNRHYKIGNLWQNTIWECWNSPLIKKMRNQFTNNNSIRIISPCNSCDVNGTLRGKNNYDLFNSQET